MSSPKLVLTRADELSLCIVNLEYSVGFAGTFYVQGAQTSRWIGVKLRLNCKIARACITLKGSYSQFGRQRSPGKVGNCSSMARVLYRHILHYVWNQNRVGTTRNFTFLPVAAIVPVAGAAVARPDGHGGSSG